MALGFFESNNAPDDAESLARKRALAEAMMMQGNDYSPIRSWTQGAARLAQGLVGGYEAGKYDRMQAEADKPIRDMMDAIAAEGQDYAVDLLRQG